MGDQIFGNELILEKVLSCLSVKELLRNACRVNHFWHSVCHKVVDSRTGMDHLFQLYRIGRQHNMGNNCRNRETHLAEDRAYDYVNDCFEAIEAKLVHKARHELDIWPQLCITFFGNFCPHSKRPERLMDYHNGFRRFLAPDTQLMNLVSHAGVIGSVLHSSSLTTSTDPSSANTSTSTSTTDGASKSSQPTTTQITAALEASVEPIESQARVGNCSGISVLLFPKYPNVEIDVFDERNLIAFEKLNARTDLKCLIVFATTVDDKKTRRIRDFQCVSKLCDKYDKRLAIGGLVIDEITYYCNNLVNTRKRTKDFYGLAFSGPNVRACSLVIKTVTPEDTERRFREFRRNLDFNPNLKTCETIGFLFACTGRGLNTEMYRRSNVEADLFRKVFPGVKLVGSFGQGEFGHNYWPSLTPEQRQALTDQMDDDDYVEHEMWHFYTSILVMINVPKK